MLKFVMGFQAFNEKKVKNFPELPGGHVKMNLKSRNLLEIIWYPQHEYNLFLEKAHCLELRVQEKPGIYGDTLFRPK